MRRLLGGVLLFAISCLTMAADDNCGSPSEPNEVLELRREAEQGRADAQFNLGLHYFNGYGVTKNYQAATAWFRKAAEQNLPIAQYNLALMYLYAQGVTQDNAEAVVWFRKAGELGVAKAQYNLGTMYLRGKGVAQDSGAAKIWLQKAAEQRIADAQYSLGQIYRDAAELVQAHVWFDLAARAGDEQAATDMKTLEERMNATQLEQAQAFAREWLLNHP